MSRNTICHLDLAFTFCGGLFTACLCLGPTLKYCSGSANSEPQKQKKAETSRPTAWGNVYVSGGFGDQFPPIYPAFGDAFVTKYDTAGAL